MVRQIFLGLLWGFCALGASAHEMRPAIATVTVSDQGVVSVALETNLEAWMAGVNPTLADTDDSPRAAQYDAYRALDAAALQSAFVPKMRDFADRIHIEVGETSVAMSITAHEVITESDPELPRLSVVRLVGGLPDLAETFRYRVDASLPSTAVRLLLPDREPQVAFVRHPDTSPLFALDGSVTRSVSAIVWDYVELGFTHILPMGIDHIVFILGLTLMSKRFIDLLLQVTAFTVAHSVTLALGLYGVLNLSPAIVEPLIAASIVYIAIENCWHQRVGVSRTVVVFAFGLLHGMGFAGVLTELGLPERDFVVGLLSFNLGVELGQLAIIALAYFAVGVWLLHKRWYRQVVAIPVSILIGGLGLYWFVERTTGWL